MKVVLDTNVIIASFAARGLCHAVFELCLDRFEIVISSFLIAEVTPNLSKKFRLPPH
jgi:predicted nucleic acid-binding protein